MVRRPWSATVMPETVPGILALLGRTAPRRPQWFATIVRESLISIPRNPHATGAPSAKNWILRRRVDNLVSLKIKAGFRGGGNWGDSMHAEPHTRTRCHHQIL